MRVRTTGTMLAAASLVAVAVAGPAQAAPRTVSGPSTGDDGLFLTYVSCADVFGAGTAPVPRINLGPYAAPAGRRSLGLVPQGGGTASGPYARIDSLAAVDASLQVAATGGTTGVAHLVTVTAANPPGTAWVARSELVVPPGSWTTVRAGDLTFAWSLVDLTSRTVVARAGSATPAQFAAEHGDGPGFVVTGFGCDGRAFNLDAIGADGSSIDFEGVALTTTAAVDRSTDAVVVTGRVTDPSGRVTGDPLVLESRAPGGAWRAEGAPVLADPDGVARAVVQVTETTQYRWHRPESQYADEGWSDPVTVEAPAVRGSATPEPTTTSTQ